MTPRKISLDVVTVATPCHENWNAMHGDAQHRFCDQCEKHVHNLSAMTRDQAQQLVSANPTGICIRLVRDERGRVITAEEPARPRRQAAFSWIATLGVMGGVATTALVWMGVLNRTSHTGVTMGIACPPTQTQPQLPVMGEAQMLPPGAEEMGDVAVLQGGLALPEPEPAPAQPPASE